MPAKTKRCPTPKCKGHVKGDFKYCYKCHSGLLRAMQESGYLQDLDFIKLEERRRERDMLKKPSDLRKKRVHGDASRAGVAVTGGLMKSAKYKKPKKEAA